MLGIPYSEYDCWGICKKFYSEVLGIDLLAWFDYENNTHEVGSKKWAVASNYFIQDYRNFFTKVRTPEFGDLVLLKLYGIPAHIGVFIGDGKFLHTSINNGSHIDRLSRWGELVEGFYRYAKS